VEDVREAISKLPPEQPEATPQWVSRSEAAEILEVHPSTVYRWTRQGILRAVKMPSGTHRYDANHLREIARGTHAR
jgi:excisionase family DNA binding protein